MEKKNIYSIMIMVIILIGIILTYNSWEMWKGWLIVWAGVLVAEIMLLCLLIVEFIINILNNGK